MSTQLPGQNPTAYLGVKETNPPQIHFRDRAPLATDARPYDRGDIWIDQVATNVWILALRIGGTATWVPCATSTAAETLTGDIGGAVPPDVVDNINVLGGTGCVTTGNPGANTITINVTGGAVTWSREAGAAIAAAVDSGYINTNVGLTTVTLPATAALGTVIEIMGESAGNWVIAQNAGQSIQFGNLSTTVGVGGSLASTNRWDTVKIVCRVADTTWSVTSNVGVLNVV